MMDIIIRPTSNYWIANNLGYIVMFFLSVILLGSDIYVVRWISLFVMSFSFIKSIHGYLYLNSLKWVIGAEVLEIHSGILSRSKNHIELYRVVDYVEEQTFIERLFGVKRIILFSSDKTTPRLTISGIDSKKEVTKVIRDRVEFNKQNKRVYEISNR